MPDPVNGGAHNVEPKESEDDVFSATLHDVEEMFLGNPFNVHVEGAGIADCTSLVHGLVHISDHYRRSKFLGGESIFSDKFPVDTGDISTRVY